MIRPRMVIRKEELAIEKNRKEWIRDKKKRGKGDIEMESEEIDDKKRGIDDNEE